MLPSANRILSKKWLQARQKIHQNKILKSKPTLSATPPPSFSHIKTNMKKARIQQERFTQIQRENRILYQKMYKILQHTPVKRTLSSKRSLNTQYRKQRLNEISSQNYQMLQRLQSKKSQYSASKYLSERKQNIKRVQGLCQYPYILGPARKRTLSRKTIRSLRTTGLQDSKYLVYSTEKVFEDRLFKVQIRTDEKIMMVTAMDEPDKFSLELGFYQAREMMGDEENYQKLLNLVKLDGGQMVLVTDKQIKMSLLSPKQLYLILQEKNPVLVMCVNHNQIPQAFLSGSTLFVIPNSIEQLLQSVTRIQSIKKQLFVLYDTGLVAKAAIFYWCMKAAGFSNVKVLAGGFSSIQDFGIEIQQGCPPLLPLGEAQAEILTKEVMSLNQFIHTDTLNKYVIRTTELSYQLLTDRGDLIEKQEIQAILERYIEDFQRGKSYMVFGKFSGLAGMYLEVLGEEEIVVVIGETTLDFSHLRSVVHTVGSDFFTMCQSQAFFDAEEMIQFIPLMHQAESNRVVQKSQTNESQRVADTSCRCLIL